MKTVTFRHALFFAVVLAMSALSGCADVHQDPASSTVAGQAVTGQPDASAPQGVAMQSAPSTSVPF